MKVYVSGPRDAAAEGALAARGAEVVAGGLDALAGADVLVLLPGWETSADAMVDVLYAQGAGVDFVELADALGGGR